MITVEEVCKDTIHMSDYFMLKELFEEKRNREYKVVALITSLMTVTAIVTEVVINIATDGLRTYSEIFPIALIIIAMSLFQCADTAVYYKNASKILDASANGIKVSGVQIYKEHIKENDSKEVFIDKQSNDSVTLHARIVDRNLKRISTVMMHTRLGEECLIYNIEHKIYFIVGMRYIEKYRNWYKGV